MAKRFFIHTFGCRVNRVESDAIAAELLEAGWQEAPLDSADVAIVNTCTVTGEADKKNRKEIRRCLSQQPGPVIITGCAINIDAVDYQEMDPRVVVVEDKTQVAQRAQQLAGIDETLEGGDFLLAYGEGFRTRPGVKVQDGCNNACTFCIVHTARGRARSANPQEVLKQVNALVDAGAQELLLVGIDVGAYAYEDVRLEDLLSLLFEQTGIQRIRIPSIEPQSITEGFIDLMARSQGRLCRHLHLVMQSGSSKVLKEMARHYDAQEYLNLVQRLRKAVPSLALSTDVIVGFPGETEDDFQQTCNMVRECGFMKLHVFPYSMRPGTPAAARPDQIGPHVKRDRAERLIALGDELALEDMRARLGSVEKVVVERPGRGTTESFHEIRFSETIALGSLVDMKLAGIDQKHHCFVAAN